MKKIIRVNSRIEASGLTILVDGRAMPVVYPRQVWRAYPPELKRVLQDNIALSSTFFVPQILNRRTIAYETSRPISEAFLFKNGIYDMSGSALVDERSSISYIKKFINTVAIFADNEIKVPRQRQATRVNKQKSIIIPFTFGKDSLLTAAVAQEIGMKPHLIYFVEPAHVYEYSHKKSLMAEFYKKSGMTVQEVQYEPGQMRYGHLWNKQTELGWGLQTTEYVLLSLPFIHFWKAEYVGLGNEHSCGESSLDEEGVLTHWSAYDQHPDWTPQQGLLASLVGGRSVQVISLVEPLHEIAEIAILHRRYPKFSQFQTSCSAIGQEAEKTRWCQRCEKCGSMFAFMKALNIDVERVGFTENLFDKNHLDLYKNLFVQKDTVLYYGIEEEVLLALFLARQRGAKGEVIRRFEKLFLPKFSRLANKYYKLFFTYYPTKNMLLRFEKKIYFIYDQELRQVRNELKKYVDL